MKAPSLTVGIEEEYQIIDPVTRDLTPGFEALIRSDDPLMLEVKPELHQCQVEIGTKPCNTIAELRVELTKHRKAVIGAAAQHGLAIASAGTHPFSNWMNQEMTPKERYSASRRSCRTSRIACSSSARTCTSGSRTTSSASTA